MPIAWNEFDDLFDQSDSDSDDDDGSKTVLEPESNKLLLHRTDVSPEAIEKENQNDDGMTV